MKLSTTFFGGLFLAATITAIPAKFNDLKRDSGTLIAARSTNTSKTWSGAVLTAPPAGTTFTAVGGTFVVPKPSPPTSGPGSWGGSAWVGIDGYWSNPYALFQAGVSWGVTVSDSGATTYDYTACKFQPLKLFSVLPLKSSLSDHDESRLL